jgi:uncharacterized damage-inducible protein DinB
VSDRSADAFAVGLAAEFRRRVAGEYLPRIADCLARLSDQQVWQRPSPNCNSVGNLLLHLEGNVRQWILSGLGGEPDQRDRPAEFRAHAAEDRSRESLLERLQKTVARACDIVASMPTDTWLEERTFQDSFRESGLAAVVHVIEHFSGHAGQVYAWTKQVTGDDLAFYDL